MFLSSKLVKRLLKSICYYFYQDLFLYSCNVMQFSWVFKDQSIFTMLRSVFNTNYKRAVTIFHNLRSTFYVIKCLNIKRYIKRYNFLGKFSDSTGNSSGSDDFVGHPLPRLDQYLHQHHEQLSERWRPHLHLCLGHHLHPLRLRGFGRLRRIARKEEDISQGNNVKVFL